MSSLATTMTTNRVTTPGTLTEPAHVVDTHALIWWLTDPAKLSPRAAQIFAAAERGETELIISAITVAELYYAHRKRRFPQDFWQLLAALKSKPFIRLVAFSADDVLDFQRDEAIPEMHDRIIAGLARRLDLPLITKDPQIHRAGIVQVVW